MIDSETREWIKLLTYGTGIPAIISMILMSTGKFSLPVESWEFTATLCTLVLFWIFHRRKATLTAADHERERNLDGYTLVLVTVSAVAWCFLTLPIPIPVLSEGLRLVMRCFCGLFMFGVITWMNWKLRNYWADKCTIKKPPPGAKCKWMRYELLVCMVDFPMAISMTAVLFGCIIIMTLLPELSIYAAFEHSKSGLNAAEIYSARLSLASTFYGGAVTFHMLIGNAVFSFIQSGRLDTVVVRRHKTK